MPCWRLSVVKDLMQNVRRKFSRENGTLFSVEKIARNLAGQWVRIDHYHRHAESRFVFASACFRISFRIWISSILNEWPKDFFDVFDFVRAQLFVFSWQKSKLFWCQRNKIKRLCGLNACEIQAEVSNVGAIAVDRFWDCSISTNTGF